ncbi:MAG TPA: hypothetical protein DCZ10_16675 [Pelotomaculum sp.]|jgi:hypothetical protein|nr:hypothetical protein [Pelotomaculum sp.]
MANAKDLLPNDIPIDIVPDRSIGGAGYGQELADQHPAGTFKYGSGPSTYLSVAPGTKTLASQQLDEQKRSNAFAETLAQKEFDSNERYRWAALAKSGSGSGSSKEPTATEMINAIRNGAVQYAQGLTKGTPFKETRGLYKGQTFMSSGETPEQAAKLTIQMLQGQLGNLPISSSNYNDIVKTVYESLGLKPPTANDSSTDDLAELLAQLRG